MAFQGIPSFFVSGNKYSKGILTTVTLNLVNMAFFNSVIVMLDFNLVIVIENLEI